MSFNSPSSSNPFPSALGKIAIFLALLPFFFYPWNSAAPPPWEVEGINNIWIFGGGVLSLFVIIFILMFELKRQDKTEAMKHIMLLVALDGISIFHLLYAAGTISF